MPLGHEHTSPQYDQSSDDEDGKCINSYDHYIATYIPVPLGHEFTPPQYHQSSDDGDGECLNSYDHCIATHTCAIKT